MSSFYSPHFPAPSLPDLLGPWDSMESHVDSNAVK